MSIFNGTADDIFNKKTDYPIGSICMFNTNIDPNEMYGGTWVRIKGKFIFGADDDTYPLGSEGGEATHTLTVDKLPENMGTFRTLSWGVDNTATGAFSVTSQLADRDASVGNSYGTAQYKLSGGGQPHNNMPPYVAFYIWAKVA